VFIIVVQRENGIDLHIRKKEVFKVRILESKPNPVLAIAQITIIRTIDHKKPQLNGILIMQRRVIPVIASVYVTTIHAFEQHA
jgi:hypothetical protein